MSTDTQPANVTAVANRPQRQVNVVNEDGPLGYLMDTAKFEHCYRIAAAMAKASLLPDHLVMQGPKNNKTMLPPEQIVGNCFMIVNQAIRWGMDPFALPPETYVVGNKLGYQGKLVAAVINSRAGLKRNLQYWFNAAQGNALAVVCFSSDTDKLPPEARDLLNAYAEKEDRAALNQLLDLGIMAVRVSVRQAKTDNDIWTKDPEQKLTYNGAIKWARRYRPEIIMGVLTDDDLDAANAAAAITRVRDPSPSLAAIAERIEGRTNGNGDGNGRTIEGTTGNVNTEPTQPTGDTAQNQPAGGTDTAGELPPGFDITAVPAGLEAFADQCDKCLTDVELAQVFDRHIPGAHDSGPAFEWAKACLEWHVRDLAQALRHDTAAYLDRINSTGTQAGLAKLWKDAEAAETWSPRDLERFRRAILIKQTPANKQQSLPGAK